MIKQNRVEVLRSIDQSLRAENRRKSLGDKAIHNIYKKTSIPLYVYMYAYVRAYV
jgi:hypothetical protein